MKTWGLMILSLIILGLIVYYLIMSHHGLSITEVVDGDTIHLSNGEIVRLLGIDTPEIHDQRTSIQFYGYKALEYLKHLALHQSVRLQFESTRRDKYNRLLAYVTLNQSGICLNEEMIRQGYGFVYTRFPFQRLDKFRKLQTEALQSGRGIWADCWRDSLPTIQRKQDLIRNAFKDARLRYQSNSSESISYSVPVPPSNDKNLNPAEAQNPASREEQKDPHVADRKSSLAVPSDGISYIGNKNSKVLHRWNCSSVKRMKPQNKVPFKKADQALKEGYKPCPHCMKP